MALICRFSGRAPQTPSHGHSCVTVCIACRGLRTYTPAYCSGARCGTMYAGAYRSSSNGRIPSQNRTCLKHSEGCPGVRQLREGVHPLLSVVWEQRRQTPTQMFRPVLHRRHGASSLILYWYSCCDMMLLVRTVASSILEHIIYTFRVWG